ncbi:hypothetical protein [Methanoregula sp.]|uniref:hypothetical protein n=1 Tax=Methanoregula sp. TaxID=2052170 RepID=UPI00237009CD|nr:hypothetical protein [Methanoregula sp.]MDD1687191.1 hypothetical protein [Methanoregula sp.]
MNQIKLKVLLFDQVLNCRQSGIKGEFLGIFYEGKGYTSGKEKTPGIIDRYIVIGVIVAVPVIWQYSSTEEYRDNHDNVFKMMFQGFKLVLYKERSHVPVILGRKIRRDDKKRSFAQYLFTPCQ